MLRMLVTMLLIFTIGISAAANSDFNHRHADWNALLSQHVIWNSAGTATTVDYAGFANDAGKLSAYLEELASIDDRTFRGWSKNDREAFLINAYNAATVQLILTRYPDLKSIKDLGGLFSSPWKVKFADLLGSKRSLDSIEHELLRGAVDYSDPRIHFAVNCASIGCPALRPEAYLGDQLSVQLQDQTERFLKDRSRNRLGPDGESVQVSKIFDWYGEDFDAHSGGVHNFLAEYADALSLDSANAQSVRQGKLSIAFTDYNWALNGVLR